MRKTEAPRTRPHATHRASARFRRGWARALVSAAIGCACWSGLSLTTPKPAAAQEILLTGPLKGAGSVHQLRLYRKQRFEFAPTATFTLLDEYLRQMIVGARLTYNITDFLALGAWGGFSPTALHFPAGLVDKIQTVNEQRGAENAAQVAMGEQPGLQNRLTSGNLGQNFADQLGSIEWLVAPQVTFVPFRGKIALFQSIYADTDFYVFAGPAIVGVKERADCSGSSPANAGGCGSDVATGATDSDGNPITVPNQLTFPMASRIALAPTFGLGFSFYVSRMVGFGFEWRATPFARNTGGFDNHGGGPDADFPNQTSSPGYQPVVDSDDADFKLNQMLSVSLNFYLPFDYQLSE